MAFLSNGAEWIQARMTYIPLETARFLGDISGLDVLDVGCGDMTADMGLLSLGPKHICGIDLHAPEGASPVEEAAATVSNAGFTLPGEYPSRLSYTPYDGRTFPFPDNCFDLVFSWAVLEHVQDVPAVLREMRRVAKPGGRIFIVVYPWYPCYTGSHLTDFIEEPYFHLNRPNEWVYGKLVEYMAAHPDETPKVLRIWQAYCTLNRYSARMFLAAAMDAGMVLERLQCHLNEEHADVAPGLVSIADAIATGTTVLLHPAKRPLAKATEPRYADLAPQQLEGLRAQTAALAAHLAAERARRLDIEQSLSWRLTRPGRDLITLAKRCLRV